LGVRKSSPPAILPQMAASSIESEVDKLYQLPLEEFTGARNALAKEAGAGGKEIRSLQKPPVAAWAVNQLYWKRRTVYDALIEAASTLRAAHKAALSGKRTDLRAAGKDHEDAIENALKAALSLLMESGNPATDATRQAIATTLRGLPADEPPGRLSRTLQPGGFEALAGIPIRATSDGGKAKAALTPSAEPSRRDADKAKAAEPDSKALAKAREAVTTATRALKLAEHTARREEFEAARAAREVEKAEREVENAKEQVEAAQQALEAAEREAAKIAKARETALKRSKEAEAALAAAQDAVRAAGREVEKLTKHRSR
jgi:hypothetical protein